MRLLALLVLLTATGCASTLSTMQTAKPLARGQFQVSGGTGLFVPVGQLATVIDQGIVQGKAIKKAIDDEQPYTLAEEDAQKLLSVGMALALAPPGSSQELMIRAGLLESNSLDVGLRLSTSSVRFDGKLRLLHGGDPDDSHLAPTQRKSLDVALGVGIARQLFKSPVLDALEVVKIDSFSRWDVEIPLYMSVDVGDIFKLYAAPKYVFSRTSLDQKLVDLAQVGTDLSGFNLTLPAHVNSHFYGASVGFALGYKYVHLYAELTGGYIHSRPRVFGQERDLGGVTLYPSVGLALKNPIPLLVSGRGTSSSSSTPPVSPENPTPVVP
ncbi:hypothetical protein [Archangium sp.]|jgi:hypothetical protein|uniref:hypothetical protein n=1 Tax=Archangium sp. TaxID=1872627 RepID=UPI002ED88366